MRESEHVAGRERRVEMKREGGQGENVEGRVKLVCGDFTVWAANAILTASSVQIML